MTPKKIRVLVVDDVKTTRYMLRSMLEQDGYEIEEAEDGLEALQKIRDTRPHIVMMDIIMPKMNGIDCCRLIKGDAVLSDTKIIMVTAKDEDIYVSASFRHGCDEFITKPIDEQELRSKVRSLGILASLHKM
jgi:twitching motility two-component system response regulator PilH